MEELKLHLAQQGLDIIKQLKDKEKIL